MIWDVRNYEELQFFYYDDLPENLQVVAKPFCDLAEVVYNQGINMNPQTELALRKLLEAKDAAVRAVIYRHKPVYEFTEEE